MHIPSTAQKTEQKHRQHRQLFYGFRVLGFSRDLAQATQTDTDSTDTNRHQQTPTDTNRHQQTPTDTNRHQQTAQTDTDLSSSTKSIIRYSDIYIYFFFPLLHQQHIQHHQQHHHHITTTIIIYLYTYTYNIYVYTYTQNIPKNTKRQLYIIYIIFITYIIYTNHYVLVEYISIE
eukprot:GHVQ01013876.1.p1 GENE.GHVQ01013876.1~~GHVQ01013876.1.p1  ORF type:complete len:175 (+),score=33.79 GHVQ01013876.1:257-781(+)